MTIYSFIYSKLWQTAFWRKNSRRNAYTISPSFRTSGLAGAKPAPPRRRDWGRNLSSHPTRTCVSGCVPILLMTHTAPHYFIQRQACHGEDGNKRRFWMGLQWPATHVQKKRNPGWEYRLIRRQYRIGFAALAWLKFKMEVFGFFPSPWPQPIYEMVAGWTCSLAWLYNLRVHEVGWTGEVTFCWDQRNDLHSLHHWFKLKYILIICEKKFGLKLLI